MSEIKDYGEPWSYNKDRTPSMERSRPAYQDRDGKTIPGKSNYADDGAVRDRALACVNALAGRDPEKLEELLKCYSLMYQRLLLSDEPINGFLAECHDALAAFEGDDK